MTDIEQLQQWMSTQSQSMASLARDIGIEYTTIYHMMVVRSTVSDWFIIEFIKRYGCDEATTVFATRLQPTHPS